jgi:hypothetical protein
MHKLIDIKVTSTWDCGTDARIIRIMVTTADESDIKDLPDNYIEVQGTSIKEQFVSVKMLDGVDRVAHALRALADHINPTGDKLSPVAEAPKGDK